MRKKSFYLILLAIMFGNLFSAKGQSDESTHTVDRQPCVAGQFYPGNPTELKQELEIYFSRAKQPETENLQAIVVPHAGYVFSGQVAAHGFNQIDPEAKFDRIFLIGSSHRTYFDGASIYNTGNYKTPLGTVEVDRKLANQLIDDHKVFQYRYDAHATEHSLEVQVPFLQYHMESDFKIVPIVIATQSEKTIQKIANALKPYFNPSNLFVISSDFSHYPSWEKANEVDRTTADAIAANSPDLFLKTIEINEKRSIPGLATSMCGWSSMLTILNITSTLPGYEIKPLAYQNSGDVAYGDKHRVVGYWAMTISSPSENDEGFSLTEKDKVDLLKVARQTLDEFVKNKTVPEIDTAGFSTNLHENTGAFVSLHVKGKLRGCIGRFQPDAPLYKVVQDMAVAAASKDHRFSPVKPDELEKVDIEISVLTPLKKIESIEEIELGRHGIYIKQGYNSGTFLPQVAASTGWNLEEFLGHCARDKARIGWDGWKTADIFTYEAIIFHESELINH
jgi:AmmeMemoRadiSam system protein B/AmmeMemoRadiSam system protein A